MRPENQKMKDYLNKNGIDAIPKFLWTGSLKGAWRIYNQNVKWFENYELMDKLTREELAGLKFRLIQTAGDKVGNNALHVVTDNSNAEKVSIF